MAASTPVSVQVKRSAAAASAGRVASERMYQQCLAHYESGRLAEALARCVHLTEVDARYAPAWHLLGVIRAQQGQPAQALEALEQACRLEEKDPAVHNSMGVVLKLLGRTPDALACYDRAIGLDPRNADAHYNRGILLKELKRPEEALEAYSRAIELRPSYADALNNRAVVLHELKRYDEAIEGYRAALDVRPRYAEARANMGVVFNRLERYEEALEEFAQALELKPGHAPAHSSRAMALTSLMRFDEALASCSKAIELRPDYAEAYNNRGVVYEALRDYQRSFENFDRAVQLDPEYAEAFNNRGNALHEINRMEESVQSYDRAVQINPEFAEAYNNRAVVLHHLGRFEEAIASYDKSIALKPDYPESRWNKSLAYLLVGDYARGWAQYEWRWKRSEAKPQVRDFVQPLWLGGESLQGKTILLHGEQGLGDMLQFCRYAPMVAALGARVKLEVPAALCKVLVRLDGVAEVLERGKPLGDFDVHCPLMSLPLAFGTTVETIPAARGYLDAGEQKLAEWSARLGEKRQPRIGLVWSGNPKHKNDHNRSFSLEQWVRWLPTGCDYVSLQKDIRVQDEPVLAATRWIRNFGAHIKDFSDTAALCRLMDLVICVDTSVAHLAGALACPTWVLLPRAPDWRWLLEREDCPWYDAVRLLRQDGSRSWPSLLQRLDTEIRQKFPGTRKRPQRKVAEPVAPVDPVPVHLRLERCAALRKAGALQEALQMGQALVRANPCHLDALLFTGALLAQMELYEEARALLRRALDVDGRHAEAWSQLGNTWMKPGDFAQAIACYDRSLECDPDIQSSVFFRGLAHQNLGHPEAALADYERAMVLKPEGAEIRNNIGLLHYAQGRMEEAIAAYSEAIRLHPRYAQAYSNRGIALRLVQRQEEGLQDFEAALAINPDYPEALNNYGTALYEQKRYSAAMARLSRAIRLKPDYADAYSNRCSVLLQLNDFQAALADSEKAIRHAPRFAGAYYNRGLALAELRRHDEALVAYDKAIEIDPVYAEAHWNKSLLLLLRGRFAEGWALYEWRWKREEGRPLQTRVRAPLWLGAESLRGKTILLHSEQGLGDTLQFCRHVSQVAALGARVILEAPGMLQGLLEKLDGVAQFLPKGSRRPAVDFQCPLMSLPHALRTTLDGIPWPGGYLRPDPVRVHHWMQRLGPRSRPRVGLVWSGNTLHKKDHNRSLALRELLSGLPDGFDYVSLQKEVRPADQSALRQDRRIRHFGDELTDFSDTAALCELVDVVISVDTSVAHLAGALGRPVWVLLPFTPDWRWLLDREDSPWYDSARLFRQDERRLWTPVVEKVAVALQGLAG